MTLLPEMFIAVMLSCKKESCSRCLIPSDAVFFTLEIHTLSKSLPNWCLQVYVCAWWKLPGFSLQLLHALHEMLAEFLLINISVNNSWIQFHFHFHPPSLSISFCFDLLGRLIELWSTHRWLVCKQWQFCMFYDPAEYLTYISNLNVVNVEYLSCLYP